jgi:hypothetical protein
VETVRELCKIIWIIKAPLLSYIEIYLIHNGESCLKISFDFFNVHPKCLQFGIFQKDLLSAFMLWFFVGFYVKGMICEGNDAKQRK